MSVLQKRRPAAPGWPQKIKTKNSQGRSICGRGGNAKERYAADPRSWLVKQRGGGIERKHGGGPFCALSSGWRGGEQRSLRREAARPSPACRRSEVSIDHEHMIQFFSSLIIFKIRQCTFRCDKTDVTQNFS